METKLNPIIARVIESSVRYALGGLTFWLGQRGILAPTLAQELLNFMAAGAVTYVALHWAYARAVFQAYLLKAASYLPVHAPPEVIAAKAQEMKQDDKFIAKAESALSAEASRGEIINKAIEIKLDALPTAAPTITPGLKEVGR